MNTFFPLSITDGLYGFVVPVIVTLVLLLILRRALPRDLDDRYPPSIAIMAGVLVGYGLLSLGDWSPSVHWHWLPYALIAAALAGPITAAESVRSVERPLVFVVVAFAAFWLLVPTWESLDPSRGVHLIASVVYVVLVASLLEPLCQRSRGVLLPIIVCATMTAGAVVLALSESLRFAQIGIAAAGALFGIVIVALFQRERSLLTGSGLLVSVLAIGSMLIGRVNSFSEVPLVSYALVPLAPVLGWFGSIGPVSGLTGFNRLVAGVVLPACVLVVAVVFAAVASMSGDDGY